MFPPINRTLTLRRMVLRAASICLALHGIPATASLLAAKTRADAVTKPAGDAAQGARRAGTPAVLSPPVTRPGRAVAPVFTVAGPGPNQAGYVHYFLLTAPDGSEEVQVALELPEQRVAWSFPGRGVEVRPFIPAGVVEGGGVEYDVQHLYGIRPFPDDQAMARFRKELIPRVALWVDNGTTYCDPSSGSACMSCLGFVMRVLFMGKSSAFAELPDDFKRTSGPYYTTEDLLLYLSGLQDLNTQAARVRRIDELTMPAAMRQELLRLVGTMAPAGKATVSGEDRSRDVPPPRRFRAAERGATPRPVQQQRSPL